MSFLYQNAQIREIERLAIESGIDEYQLMEHAGRFAFDTLREAWPEVEKIIVCAGKGNNAGDGYVLARLAKQSGKQVVVYALFPIEALKGAALRAAKAASEAGVKIVAYQSGCALDADVIVDALLGSGLQGEVREPFLSFIDAINDHNVDVLAMDIPSGINADTGCIQGAAIDAEITVTLIGLKQGLYTRKGAARCGKIVLNSLEIPQAIFSKVTPAAETITWEQVCKKLPSRQRDAHKGDYGHVLVIGGDYGMGGAVRMAAEAALRAGAGLVTVATRPEHVPVVSSSRPELMCHQVADAQELAELVSRVNVIVIGPGLGKTPWAEMLLEEVLKSTLPKLLDADALNLLSERIQHCDNWVLTPHPGEAARLLQTSCQELQQDRFQAVTDLQKQYGGVSVLKGSGTLIKGGAGPIKVCAGGNPGMASGGMGDVLSGIIGGLIAQQLDVAAAAEIGVYVHAKAGDLAVESGGGERGLLATDIFTHLRKLLNPK